MQFGCRIQLIFLMKVRGIVADNRISEFEWYLEETDDKTDRGYEGQYGKRHQESLEICRMSCQ